ncbi:hypothetical protein [Methanobrevibacter curvatus]|uniref:DUF4367 domain-containing protein n=1 Tax=Methanobrevibacter curvatus TaxID=49547 RepID=A0A166C1P7_9EURY|nr:hypothetical protein [Methanobrevibacter curvatus]KZX14039.1 hypothetical protein MBCUR_06570 [Methanobrevibacter curvatus]
MNDKKLIGIIIIAIIIFFGVYMYFSGELTSGNWEIKEVNGLKFKVPNNLANGSTFGGNIVDGVNTGYSYIIQEPKFIVEVYDFNANQTNENDSSQWQEQLDKLYQNPTANIEVAQIDGNEVQTIENIIGEGNMSYTFFKVQNKEILIKWDKTITLETIKEITKNFYELN